MTSMEIINGIRIDADVLSDFIRWFNNNIQMYGKVTVADLMEEGILLFTVRSPEVDCYTDYVYGWTKQINAKDHFVIEYAMYGSKLPCFRLKLPDYKYLEE